MNPDDAVFSRLSRLAQKLDDVKTERDQLLYQNQLLATDLKLSADLARGYCEERDTAEEKVEELEDELAATVAERDEARTDVVVARCSLRNLTSLQATTQTALDTARAMSSLGWPA